MLVEHGLDNKIFAFNADNATSNDTQTKELDALLNSFNAISHVRCFNHTLQLAVKALLRPFSCNTDDDDEDEEVSDMPGLESIEEEDDEAADDDEGVTNEDDDNTEDPFADLTAEEQATLLEATKDAHTILSKASRHLFLAFLY
ncbi:hypothetical protein H0H92_009553 [Tricholoma furcatifolium]|nr:hypothetical protein H0H92_009553 [Tricholoma furcatifolium]